MIKMSNKKSKKQQIAYLKKICRGYDVPTDLIDWSTIDSDLSYEENKTEFLPKIKKLASSKDNGNKIDHEYGRESDINGEKRRIQRHREEELTREEEYTKKQLDRSINTIKTATTDKLNEYFYTPKKLIETLVNSENTHGLILKGNAGIGKSFTTIQKLREMGLKKGEDYEILQSYTTPLSLYRFIYENREKIIVIDDTMAFFNNDIIIGMVLGSLWGDGGRRIVQYNSSHLKTIPNKFEFKGKMICCLNDIPQQLEHVKSRCFYYEIKFSNEEVMELITEIAKIKNIPMKVVDFINENMDKDVVNLDLRLLFKVYDVFKNNKQEWKEIASNLINKDKRVGIMIRSLRKHDTVKEAFKDWKEKTGDSRRTFQRLKAKFNVE